MSSLGPALSLQRSLNTSLRNKFIDQRFNFEDTLWRLLGFLYLMDKVILLMCSDL